MIVRQAFHELPPRPFLMQVLDNIAQVYVFLWDRKSKENVIDLTWKELTQLYNKNMFRSSLRKLNHEGLLSYDESDYGLKIELVGWDDLEVD